MKKKVFPLSKVFTLLEPGPVVMMTTVQKGKQNIMTMSWHTMLEFEPPLIGCVISDRDYSFAALKTTKECVIAIPTIEIAVKVVQVGNTSGRTVDKFKKFGLSAIPASLVKAPLVGECYANLECSVVDTSMVKKYGFFVLEVKKAWIDPSQKNPRTIHHKGKGVFMVAGETVKFPSKMK
jgi:flavin reductase (DIM6/NTAB) family NADH-FMN oxidoreductase RutF